MLNVDIRDKCFVNTNYDNDTFVGIKCINGNISINFPLGFNISGDNTELRKDIILLISTLAANTKRKQSEILGQIRKYEETDFPIQAYMFIISDYYVRGYYKEREVQHAVSKNGKINWNRTIKTQKPYVQGNEVYYLDFVTKKNTINENELITLVHEYCVYNSFEKIGWLFTKNMPAKPKIKFNRKLFISVIKDKISCTFNDRNRVLFNNMLAIINYKGDAHASKNYKYGTYRFEYVWEKMIDKVFGIENKSDYFPKTIWTIKNKKHNNASLEPDTIMLLNNNVYVIDAKYYKYGETGKPSDLPESTSINKQITYGEYISEEEKFRKIHGENMRVYNSFIMPFNAQKRRYSTENEFLYIGEAISSWKKNNKSYDRIQGILVDIKYLMKINVRQEESAIYKLAEIIDKAIHE
ncbi:LlaJI family restriction endonuclease [Clostridium botulinum]|uniref:LlaJI family restriction endonuclease n=1 Tax=Clostridium botulinum TaxID=1491 RepID=UPI001400BD9D|nr:LlaJI family restriction endonuclease [Clostridium botulinum]MBY6915760.1 LlaJI family restriction endonuclease [Clostridium botulinum]NFO39230.1 LlaJI family restriction endonuclease [Clostridium botulinum]NFQ40150.1 LlaJI family restriction endonuclease [Clostridium botulinum]